MIGGKIVIPNFFLRKIIYPEVPVTGDDIGLGTNERFLEDMLQASFFMNTELNQQDFTINKKLKLKKRRRGENLLKKKQDFYLSFFCRQSLIAALIASSARTEQ